MSVNYISHITERYQRLGYTPYRWYSAESPPDWCAVKKPLKEARLGVLSTSGAYVVGQTAYHYKDDTSIRKIPNDTPASQVRFSHITENYLVGPRQDPDSILPLTALRRLERQGDIGALESIHSCMGGIYSQRRVREELIPELERQWKNIDALLLVAM